MWDTLLYTFQGSSTTDLTSCPGTVGSTVPPARRMCPSQASVLRWGGSPPTASTLMASMRGALSHLWQSEKEGSQADEAYGRLAHRPLQDEAAWEPGEVWEVRHGPEYKGNMDFTEGLGKKIPAYHYKPSQTFLQLELNHRQTFETEWIFNFFQKINFFSLKRWKKD